jgi:hypothetical protein
MARCDIDGSHKTHVHTECIYIYIYIDRHEIHPSNASMQPLEHGATTLPNGQHIYIYIYICVLSTAVLIVPFVGAQTGASHHDNNDESIAHRYGMGRGHYHQDTMNPTPPQLNWRCRVLLAWRNHDWSSWICPSWPRPASFAHETHQSVVPASGAGGVAVREISI